MVLEDLETALSASSKFNNRDWVRIQYCSIENEALMMHGAYQIESSLFTPSSNKWMYSLFVNNTLSYFKEHQIRHAHKYEILEAKICQSAML